MKLEVSIDGRPARLVLEGQWFRYEHEGAEAIECKFSVEPLAARSYSVLIEGRSYAVILGPGNEIQVNGRMLSVEVFDPRSMRARSAAGAGEGRQRIAALMPGKVVRMLVEQGDMVESGQGLVVVEAMKMQNEMKSPKTGRVVEVRTRTDATVAAGEVLVVIE